MGDACPPSSTSWPGPPSLFGSAVPRPLAGMRGAWCLAALFALPDDRRSSSRSTAASHRPRSVRRLRPPREGWLIVGRRGGKSRIAALVAVYLALPSATTARSWLPARGASVMLIAADRRQARVLMRYIAGPARRACRCSARHDHAPHAGDHRPVQRHRHRDPHGQLPHHARATRSWPRSATRLPIWRDETAANPDTEILAALRPAMATVPGRAAARASARPYARRGALWQAYRRTTAKDDGRVSLVLAGRHRRP